MIERHSLTVRTPIQAGTLWGRYVMRGTIKAGRIGPRELVRETPPAGLEIPHQVAVFVEETPGFWDVRLLMWMAFRGGRECVLAPIPPRLARFFLELDERLPYEFLPPRHELAGIEIDEALRIYDRPHLEAIERKYRERYPGFKLS